MKKLICLVLSAIMLIGVTMPALTVFATGEDRCNCGNSPIVFVIGRTTIYKDLSGDQRDNALSVSDEEIAAAAKEVMPYFAKAIFLNQWDAYCDELYNAVTPFFADYVLSDEGTVTNHSGATWSWDKNNLPDRHNSNDVYSYKFEYDARLDPCEIADELNEYIEKIKEVTGHSKVSIISRCLGTNIAMAYVEKYQREKNYSGIDAFVMYSGTLNGTALCSKAYSGKLVIEADSVNRYASDVLDLDDELLNDLVLSSIAFFNQTYTLEIGTAMINQIYDRVYENVLPRILMSTFGTSPGYWSMVADEDYEDAKALNFSDNADGRFDILISKIDNYHYNVQCKANEMLNAMEDAGVRMALVCKYGFQLVPVVENANVQSDNTIELVNQSFGATCSPVNETLSSEYIINTVSQGKGRYISPDRQIDASTGRFPDSTWYIKNLLHNPFPSCVDPLLLKICYSDTTFTVNSDPAYPQFMVYNDNTITPMDAENQVTNSWVESLPTAFQNFVTALINYLKNYFSTLFEKYSGTVDNAAEQ